MHTLRPGWQQKGSLGRQGARARERERERERERKVSEQQWAKGKGFWLREMTKRLHGKGG